MLTQALHVSRVKDRAAQLPFYIQHRSVEPAPGGPSGRRPRQTLTEENGMLDKDESRIPDSFPQLSGPLCRYENVDF